MSVTTDRNLDDRRKALKAAILEKLRNEGLDPQAFWESGEVASSTWNFENVERVMRKCIGAVVIGFPRWQLSGSASPVGLIGEYNHYEGAVALSHHLPTLLLAERGVEDRGIVETGGGELITFIPEDAQTNWLEEAEFQERFKVWADEVGSRKDVFLGYCSQNAGTAALIENYLTRENATVLNYTRDFQSGASILDEITNASACCSSGIFLFAENDLLKGSDGDAAPRDNVVFEAGYFMSSKGSDRCLIIRQGNAKMPDDLGGAIHLYLESPNNIAPIETQLMRFLDENL